MSLASMLTLATSLTMTPTLMPSRFSSRFLRAEVLPEPRNPASRVMGTAVFPSSSVVVSAAVEKRRLLAERRPKAAEEVGRLCWCNRQALAATAEILPVPERGTENAVTRAAADNRTNAIGNFILGGREY